MSDLRFASIVLALAGLIAAGCADEEAPAGQRGGSSPLVDGLRAIVTVTVERPDHDAFSYVIACEGGISELQGGADIDPDAACDALAREDVRARLLEGPPPGRVCAQVYGGADTARITGSIDGEDFETSVDRTDGCGIADWDGLLEALLIEPRAGE